MKLFNNIKLAAGNGMIKMKAKSPEILMVAGVIGVIGSTVAACKATRKLDGILDEHQKHIDEISEYVESLDENRADADGNVYSEKDERHDIAVTYKDTVIGIVKLYAVPVLTGALSIACIFQSHRILNRRLMAMSTLYNSTDQAFKAYRKRVAEKIGAEEERNIRYGIKKEEVEEVQENGKKKKRIVDTMTEDPTMYSPYARYFDESSPMWDRNADYNKLFLVSQQEIANNQLQAKRRLFLNEVYDMLGLQQTEAGQRVGWIYDKENPIGDNFVDFGIYDLYSNRGHDFVNGLERNILLDFNVDGDILTKAFTEKI